MLRTPREGAGGVASVAPSLQHDEEDEAPCGSPDCADRADARQMTVTARTLDAL